MRRFFTLHCRSSLALSLLALAGLSACVSSAPATTRVSVLTFNVENLFDTRDDPDRRDEAYLPLAQKQSAAHKALCQDVVVPVWRDECLYQDWNERVLETKLERVAAAILKEPSGRGADIVILQEVENLAVLERLRTEYLGPAGYLPAVLIEGTDARGIDVAILSRWPLLFEAVLHPVTFADIPERARRDTRGILEATFAAPGARPVTVFAVHFPAPFHPPAMRERSYDVLNELRAAVPTDRLIVAGGDFNTTSTEVAARDTLNRKVRPHWQLAQDHGCTDCPGTHYYAPEDNWSFLDTVLWSAPADCKAEALSVRLANTAPEQATPAGTPAAFRLPAASGVSDHWPLFAELTLSGCAKT